MRTWGFEYVRQLSKVWSSPGNRGAKTYAMLQALVWFSSKRFLSRPIRKIVFTDRILHCYPDGFISNSVMLFGEWHEYDALHFIEGWLRPEDHYLDVGANVGLYALLASRRVAGSDIVCVEPGKVQLSRLKENLDANKISALVLPYCVSDEPGVARMTSGDAVAHVSLGESARGDDEDVTAAKLDDIVPDRIYSLMKLDVEGFELKALTGAARLITGGKLPAILFELNGSSDRYGVGESEVPDLLRRQGYTLGIYNHDQKVFDATAPLRDDVLALSEQGLQMLAIRLPNVKLMRA